MYKYLAPSSPNPFSRRRRGTKSLAPFSPWERGWGRGQNLAQEWVSR
ncbi:hypothetical protein FDUTEX481_06237 [Tolypothrix sp. PCC 7601]|nr:hypothetical protein FDUTEX481_06237 [Tolypothrix sp. PCC 7601]